MGWWTPASLFHYNKYKEPNLSIHHRNSWAIHSFNSSWKVSHKNFRPHEEVRKSMDSIPDLIMRFSIAFRSKRTILILTMIVLKSFSALVQSDYNASIDETDLSGVSSQLRMISKTGCTSTFWRIFLNRNDFLETGKGPYCVPALKPYTQKWLTS